MLWEGRAHNVRKTRDPELSENPPQMISQLIGRGGDAAAALQTMPAATTDIRFLT